MGIEFFSERLFESFRKRDVTPGSGEDFGGLAVPFN
jgi:hypothetical protein